MLRDTYIACLVTLEFSNPLKITLMYVTCESSVRTSGGLVTLEFSNSLKITFMYVTCESSVRTSGGDIACFSYKRKLLFVMRIVGNSSCAVW